MHNVRLVCFKDYPGCESTTYSLKNQRKPSINSGFVVNFRSSRPYAPYHLPFLRRRNDKEAVAKAPM